MEFKRVNSTLETRAVQAFMPNTESGVKGAVAGAKAQKLAAKQRGVEDFVQAAHRFAHALQGAGITRDAGNRAEENAGRAKAERDRALADRVAADRLAREQAAEQARQQALAREQAAEQARQQALAREQAAQQKAIAEAREREKKAQDSHQGTMYTLTAMGVMNGMQLAGYKTPDEALQAYEDAMKESREGIVKLYGENNYDTGAIGMKLAETDHKARVELYNKWFEAKNKSAEASVAATLGILSDNGVVDEAAYREKVEPLVGVKTEGEIDKLVQTAMKQGANTAFRRDVAKLREDMDNILSTVFKEAIENGKAIEQAQEEAQERALALAGGYFDALDKEALNDGAVAEKERSVNRQGRALIGRLVAKEVRDEARANAKTSAGVSAAGLGKALNIQELEELRSLREDDGQDLSAFSRGTRDFVSAMQSATLADNARDTIENSAWGASRGVTKAVVANDLGVLDMSKLEDRRTAAKILQSAAGYLTRADMDELNEQVWGQIDALSQGKVDDIVINQRVWDFIKQNKMFGMKPTSGKEIKDASPEAKVFISIAKNDLKGQSPQVWAQRLRDLTAAYYEPDAKRVGEEWFNSGTSAQTSLRLIRRANKDPFPLNRKKETNVRLARAGKSEELPFGEQEEK